MSEGNRILEAAQRGFVFVSPRRLDKLTHLKRIRAGQNAPSGSALRSFCVMNSIRLGRCASSFSFLFWIFVFGLLFPSAEADPNTKLTSKIPITSKQFISSESTNALIPYERIFVSTTNTIMNLRHFTRTTPPPWTNGNALEIRISKPRVAGTDQEFGEWAVVNMHGENFGEIVKRLKISTFEIAVFHTVKTVGSVQEPGKLERRVVFDNGYAVVIDKRIPRKWVSTREISDREMAKRMQQAFPQCFGNVPDQQQPQR